MENIFGTIYDLRQGLLLNDDVKSLKTTCLFHVIPLCFKPEFLIKNMLPIYPEVTDPNSYVTQDTLRKRWDKIENTVIEEAKKIIFIPIDKDIADITHFVGTQIYHFLAKNRYPIITIILILKNLVFTYQGTINLEATFLKVLEIKYIPVTEKFEIACQNFMGENIINEYFINLPEASFGKYLYESPIVKENIPIYYWICELGGFVKRIECSDFEGVYGELGEIYFSNDNSLSAMEYILYWSFISFNDMAVQYFWQNFVSRTTDKCGILNVIFTKVVYSNFRMGNSIVYLLFNISEREIGIFYNLPNLIVFEYILLELRWQNFFSKVFDVLHINFNDGNFILLLKFILSVTCSNIKDKFDKCVLREILVKMPVSVKKLIITDHRPFFVNMIQKLYLKGDLESCSLLLTIDGPLDDNCVILTSSRATLFDLLVCSGHSIIIDDILLYSINSSTAVDDFKILYFKRRASIICRIFISFNLLSSLNCLIDWCLTFAPLKDINKLKSTILLIEDGKLLKELLFKDQETIGAFQDLDAVLQWCFDSQDHINNFKNRIIIVKKDKNNNINDSDSVQINIYVEIRNCVTRRQFEFLRRLFQWKKCSIDEIERIRNCLEEDLEDYKDFFNTLNVLNYFTPIIGFNKI